jgi:hypothetical protein
MGVFTQYPGADGMKCARPREIDLSGAEGCRSYLFHPTSHVEGSAPRESQQEDPVRINTVDN